MLQNSFKIHDKILKLSNLDFDNLVYKLSLVLSIYKYAKISDQS